MKKFLFLFIFTATIAGVKAQNGEMYSFMLHDMGDYHISIENAMQQHDGVFFINLFLGVDSGSPYQPPINVGNIFYKMSPSSLTITDSLFVENPDGPYYLFAPNPNGEGNIRANFEYHEDCDSTFLRICHFPDDDLNINHEEDIVVPMCEGYASGEYDSQLVDCWGDLIMKYYKDNNQGGYDIYMARFDSNGTLKHQALVFENNYNGAVPKMGILKESPLRYYQWIESNENLSICVIDSLFNTSPVIINRILNEEIINQYSTVYEYLKFSSDTEVIPVGGDDILVAASYTTDTNFNSNYAEHGMAVVKYDLRTLQRKNLIVYNDYPGETGAQCMGLKKMKDGTVYFLYKEVGYPNGSIIVVKMDTDLNVEWKRFCKTDNITISAPLLFPVLYEDEDGEEKGIAWAGYGRKPENDKPDLFYFFLKHDGTVGINETDNMIVRPYAFYPNPVKEQLHMQFSPDVRPAQVELYDLQGRLLRTQGNNFESIDLSLLPTGTYMMRVTLENGAIYSDKVVKE